MLISPLKLVCFALGLVNLFSISSLGCSYADGALFPSDYDLVRETDAIVLVQATAKEGYTVDFKVLEVLKGDFTAKKFRGSEEHTSCNSFSFSVELREIVAPELEQKLPKIYPKYLLFLEKNEDEWKIAIAATERMNETIIDPALSAFLRNVRHFVRISSINDYELEKQELKRLRQHARNAKDPKSYPRELVDLIDDHLTSPSPNKSYKDLLDLFARLPKEDKRKVLWAFAWGKHPEAAAFFTDLLRAKIPLNYAGPISKYAAQTKNYDLLVRLGRDYPKLGKYSRWPIMSALVEIADDRHKELMLTALRSADKEEAARMADWFVRYPSDEALEIVRRLVGQEFQENWELTFGLAGMGDVGTINWAGEFMNSNHNDRWMAYYTIAYSPLDKADELARLVIKGADAKGLASLIQGYEDSHNPNRENRLRDIIALRERTPDVNRWLLKTLEGMESKGEKGAVELLAALKEQTSIKN